LSEFRGRPLLINVWASWCGPCKQEMASLERLAWSELAQKFDVIGISTDDSSSQAASWLERSHSTISQFIDTRQEMENILGASRIPLTVLVDADGRVLDKIYGAREWDTPQALALLRAKFAL
jgi:thiol-disulfide isomerase/thioredoxin